MKFNASEAPIEVIPDSDKFAKVPFKIAERKKVTGGAVKLYIIYWSYTFNWRGFSDKWMKKRPTQKEIAKRMKCTVKTISNLTTELHNKGWITAEWTGRVNRITLHLIPKRRKPRKHKKCKKR